MRSNRRPSGYHGEKSLLLENNEEYQEDHLELDTNPSTAEFHSYFQVLREDLEKIWRRVILWSGCKLMQMTMAILT